MGAGGRSEVLSEALREKLTAARRASRPTQPGARDPGRVVR